VLAAGLPGLDAAANIQLARRPVMRMARQEPGGWKAEHRWVVFLENRGQGRVTGRQRDRCLPGQHITEKPLVAKYGKRLPNLWQTFAIISKARKNRNNGAQDDMVLAPGRTHSGSKHLPVIYAALCDWREVLAGFAGASPAPAAGAHS